MLFNYSIWNTFRLTRVQTTQFIRYGAERICPSNEPKEEKKLTIVHLSERARRGRERKRNVVKEGQFVIGHLGVNIYFPKNMNVPSLSSRTPQVINDFCFVHVFVYYICLTCMFL